MTASTNLETSPRRIINDLVAGRVSAADLSLGQAWKVISTARASARAHQDRIQSLVLAGRGRVARKELRRFINSMAARVTAASDAVRVPRSQMQMRFARVWAVAQGIGYHHQPGIVRVRKKRNARDRTRLLCEFCLLDKAQQHLLGMAIKPFCGTHPSQFSAGRGRSGAVEELLRLLTNANGETVSVITDVRRFFDNVDHQWLEENLPLPRSLIRSTIHNGGLRLRASGRRQALPTDVEIEVMGQRGIPQGSALSAIVAEWVIGELLRSSTGRGLDAQFIAYSDNLVAVMAADGGERLINALRVGYLSHPAGPFEITASQYGAGTPFRFMGYNFVRKPDGLVEVVIDSDIADERLAKFATNIADCPPSDIDGYEKKFRSYCAAFGSAQNMPELLASGLRSAAQEREYRLSLTIQSSPEEPISTHGDGENP